MEEYTYYMIESNQDGWILSVYSSYDGYIDTVDYCSFHDYETLLKWRKDYDIDIPSVPELHLSPGAASESRSCI